MANKKNKLKPGDRKIVGFHWQNKKPKKIKGAVVLSSTLKRLTYHKSRSQMLKNILDAQRFNGKRKRLVFRVVLEFVGEV